MRSERRDDAGMVTAELAACLPVLVLLLAFVMSVSTVGTAAVRAQDAAREAARAAARGDEAMARRLAQDAAPGAALSLHTADGTVSAVVSLRPHLLVPWLPSITVTGRAVSAAEPTVPP